MREIIRFNYKQYY